MGKFDSSAVLRDLTFSLRSILVFPASSVVLEPIEPTSGCKYCQNFIGTWLGTERLNTANVGHWRHQSEILWYRGIWGILKVYMAIINILILLIGWQACQWMLTSESVNKEWEHIHFCMIGATVLINFWCLNAPKDLKTGNKGGE